VRTIRGRTEVTLELGDITEHEADAVVNAANSGLRGGGGVDGAIHRAGGPAILAECEEILARQGRLPPGRAAITGAGRLPARRVIHTVGPIWRGGGRGEREILESCYRSSLSLAAGSGLRSVAFSSISTGVYGYPVAEAAVSAVSAVLAFLDGEPDAFDRITWVLFDEGTFEAYRIALERAAG